MPDFINNIQQQLNEFWQGLDNGQKTKLVSIVALCTLVIVVGIYLISKPSYVTLFSTKLSDKDLADATKALDTAKITYKLSDTNDLLVPQKDRLKAKSALTSANIPRSGTATYSDVMSTTKLGTTESDKRRAFIETMAGKIEQDLVQGANSISDARVNLNIPENSGFLGDNTKATASVKVIPNGDLTPSQIEGIARFVANSVEGLDPKNVEVVDNNNVVLKDYDDAPGGGADKHYTLEQTKKKEKEKEIREMLANQSTDYDDVKVVANLKLDFDTETTSKETIEAPLGGEGAPLQKQESSEILNNGSTGGVPGTDSNNGTPSYPNSGSGSGSSYQKSDSNVTYGYDKTNTQQNKALGQVDRNNSTIAVSLYYGRSVEQTPSQAVIDNVTELVSKASGLSPDKITVRSLKVSKVVAPKSSINFGNLLSQYGTFAIAAILIGLLAYAVMSGTKYKVSTVGGGSFGPHINREKTLEEIQLEERSEVKKQIDKFVKQKPEAVASLLRNWLSEDWE